MNVSSGFQTMHEVVHCTTRLGDNLVIIFYLPSCKKGRQRKELGLKELHLALLGFDVIFKESRIAKECIALETV